MERTAPPADQRAERRGRVPAPAACGARCRGSGGAVAAAVTSATDGARKPRRGRRVGFKRIIYLINTDEHGLKPGCGLTRYLCLSVFICGSKNFKRYLCKFTHVCLMP